MRGLANLSVGWVTLVALCDGVHLAAVHKEMIELENKKKAIKSFKILNS